MGIVGRRDENLWNYDNKLIHNIPISIFDLL